MKALIHFFYKRKLFCNVITVFIFILGLLSILAVRKDLFPPIDFNIVIFTASFSGASPEQIEKIIINPMEQSIREVSGIKEIESKSTQSRGVIIVTLDPNVKNPDKIVEDIKDAVDRVEDYPKEATKPISQEINANNSNPFLYISFSSEELSYIELRDWVRNISTELEFVPGLSQLEKVPWPKKEILVNVKKELLKKYHVSFTDIVTALKQQNVQLPGGDAINEQGEELSIKTDGEFTNLEDIANTVIRSNIEGYTVKIKDIASVSYGLNKINLYSRTNSKRSFIVKVIKDPKSDVIRINKNIREYIKKLKEKIPSSISINFSNDVTTYLTTRLKVLSTNLLIGIFLIITVLTLLLPFRVALVVAIGIPFAILSSISTIYLFGLSINLISLVGLIIVSGMVVDDVVVVVENIYRKLESKKMPIDQAIVTGASEMAVPVLSSVLTTIAAFSPLLFMTGIFGKFIFEIPLMIIVALLFSILEGFFIAPVHFSSLAARDTEGANKSLSGYRNKINSSYKKLLTKYEKIIRLSLKYPYRTLSIVFIFILGGTAFIASKMDFVLFPSHDSKYFYVFLEAKPGTSVNKMEKITAKVEKYIESSIGKDDLISYISTIGLFRTNNNIAKRASHLAQIQVELTPYVERDRTMGEVIADFKKAIKIPPEVIKFSTRALQGGPPQGKPISINIAGEELQLLKEIMEKVKKELRKIPHVTDINDSDIIGKKEIRIIPNQTAIKQAGLTLNDLASTVRGAFEGVEATKVRTLNEDITIRVRVEDTQKIEKETELKELKIGNKKGNLIPLKSIADFEYGTSSLLISHENYKRVMQVTAEVEEKKTTARKAIKAFKQKVPSILKEYPNYSIYFGGEDKDTKESLSSLKSSAIIALLLILIILIVSFNSFFQPLLILLTIPMGFVGAIWALLLHGKPMSFMASLGTIALAGVIVNNGIVFLDFYNRLKKTGLEIKEALVQTATTRLRPIILTSITTIFGLIPTAYGIGGRDEFVMVICITIAWGLIIGLILTTLTIPSLLITGTNIGSFCAERWASFISKIIKTEKK